MIMPQIVYFQTITACNGHCRYCPFDDVYSSIDEMSFETYSSVLIWLKENKYRGRVGFLLHYEPTMDLRLCDWLAYARRVLPGIRMEVATNGIINDPVLESFDAVDIVKAGTQKKCNSRAGNVRACPEIMSRATLESNPCPVPGVSMCIAATGEVLLCCQDWRHEAVVGTVADLGAARENQLSLIPKVHKLELEICQDCMAGKTAEEVGERLGQRYI